jgi:hypothetical protein
VKALLRGLGLMFLGAILLGSTGCGTDNEKDAENIQKTAGPPPPAAEGATVPTTPKYNSMEDYAKGRKQDIYEGTKLDTKKKK